MCMITRYVDFRNVSVRLAVQQIILVVADHVFLLINRTATLSCNTFMIDEDMCARHPKIPKVCITI